MVYFIWCPASNCVKIGVSGDPEGRLRDLQTANPSPLFLLGSIPGDERVESKLHASFKHLKVSNEWFRTSDDLMWFIRRTISRQTDVGEATNSGRAQAAIDWLEERFRERREWFSEELRLLASQNGLSRNALWEPGVQELPIRKRQRVADDGRRYWVWIADGNWPSESLS